MKRKDDDRTMGGGMADRYEGRKFKTIFAGKDLPEDSRLAEVMRWGAELHSMGLLPAESGGHAGNISFRNSKGFVITAISKEIVHPTFIIP